MGSSRILIVEDERIVAKDIEHSLVSLGYAVVGVARSGEEALTRMAADPPDLVLMDVMLRGEMDGARTADEIRRRFQVPVIYLTAYADAATLQRTKVTEPFGYIIKPFEERELHSTIEIALYKHQIERRLRESEERCRRMNIELERRVERRTAELVELNKELESFSYTVSHDLRTPLRHILGFANALAEHPPVAADPVIHRQVHAILGAIGRADQLISDLLSFSQMGRSELREMEVRVDELVNAVRLEMQTECCQRPVEWRIAPLPGVRADPAMLRVVLRNLIGNALKYSRSRTPSVIEIDCVETGQEFTFRIRDNGVGFNMRYVGKLFNVFQRLHSHSDFEGTGIGLAIVRRVIERHGGRVWAEGEVNHGATFHFTLPR